MTLALILMTCLFPSSLLGVFWISTRTNRGDLRTMGDQLERVHRVDQEASLRLIETLCSSFFVTKPDAGREQPTLGQILGAWEEDQTPHPEQARAAEEDFFSMGAAAWTPPAMAARTVQDSVMAENQTLSSPPLDLG